MRKQQELKIESLGGRRPSHAKTTRRTPKPKTADPASPAEVGAALLKYFADGLAVPGLAFRKPPEENRNGWEAYTYGFELQPVADLPGEFHGPLIARIYCSPQALERARHEFLAIRHVRQWGYPVPEPLLLEEDKQYFGGPFLLMTRVVGLPLLEDLMHNPFKILLTPRRMAKLQQWLHRLPTEGFPAESRPLLERRLDEMADIIRVLHLSGLAPGLEWLCRERPPEPELPSLVHMDYHPINLIACGRGRIGVLDWTEADLGDPHADVATSLMLMECIPAGETSWYQRLLVFLGRRALCMMYRRNYRRGMPLRRKRLNYYRALATLWRLCRYGQWLRAGPEITGSKPTSIQHLTADHVRDLERYFERWTGVEVHL